MMKYKLKKDIIIKAGSLFVPAGEDCKFMSNKNDLMYNTRIKDKWAWFFYSLSGKKEDEFFEEIPSDKEKIEQLEKRVKELEELNENKIIIVASTPSEIMESLKYIGEMIFDSEDHPYTVNLDSTLSFLLSITISIDIDQIIIETTSDRTYTFRKIDISNIISNKSFWTINFKPKHGSPLIIRRKYCK